MVTHAVVGGALQKEGGHRSQLNLRDAEVSNCKQGLYEDYSISEK